MRDKRFVEDRKTVANGGSIAVEYPNGDICMLAGVSTRRDGTALHDV